MGTGSALSGFAKLPIPNPFKYIFVFRKKSPSEKMQKVARNTWQRK
jgi:hypothetical protein